MPDNFSTDLFSLDDVRPRSWLDAFPWLSAVGGEDAWWHGIIDEATPLERETAVGTISGLAMERLSHWTIGQLFPGLPPQMRLADLRLTTRGHNAMSRQSFKYASDLNSVTLDTMVSWRQVGIGTVDAILQVLADASTTTATPSVLAERQVPEPAGPEEAKHPSWLTSLIDDLTLLATWHVAVGKSTQEVLSFPLPPGSPDEVVKARQRVGALRASDVLSQDELDLDVAGLFDDALTYTLDPRAALILAKRLFAGEPMTLDELGKELDVTRERVRQIEGKARAAMLGYLESGSALGMVAEAARNVIGVVRPLDDLLTLVPALAKRVDAVDQSAWRVLDRLDDAYEIEDGWCVVPTMSAAQALTQSRLQEFSNQYGVVPLEDFQIVEALQPKDLMDLTRNWLTYCGYTVFDDFIFTRTQSVGDYAASILWVIGSPLSAQEIIDRFHIERTPGSLRNTMSIDDRFQRVDRDQWALAEWGLDTYDGVRSLIREQVARGGGRAHLEALVEHITGKYSVTASSVVAYASSPPFELRDGIVRRATGDRQIRKTPEQTRRLYRRPDAWVYRVRITKDHLRGSGTMAPMAIASILDLQYGDSRQLASSLGPQSVNWTGIQPSFGTIRRFLLEYDVPADTEAFLVIGDDASFSLEIAPEATGVPLRDALNLVGAPTDVEIDNAHVALSRAVGQKPESSTISIIGAYRERGDSDVAELLTAVRATLETATAPNDELPHVNVDEILDLL